MGMNWGRAYYLADIALLTPSNVCAHVKVKVKVGVQVLISR